MRLPTAAAALLVVSPVQADPLKEGNVADAPALSAAEQLTRFTAAEGFVVERVADEEQGVVKPVAVAFDDEGRLWTLTATEYPADMNDAAHAEHARALWAQGGRDRILVVDHPLGPGPHAPRVFAEKLAMPMGLLPAPDGVWVAQGPRLLRLRDTDGDGRADQTDTLASGFGVQDTHTMAHGLTRLPGGRVLVAQGVLAFGDVTDAAGARIPFHRGKFATFRTDGSGFQLLAAGLNNTWGLHLDGQGQLWGQEANVFDHPVVPLEEGVHLHGWHPAPFVDNPVWQPGVGALDLGGTGLSGLAISEDVEGGFPGAWRTAMLVANPITGSINSVNLTRDAKGAPVVTRGPDLLTCADRRFRPIHLVFGPDGCLYVTDWYNPVISHNEVPRDHPARDKTRGRIWRVRHQTQDRRSAPDVAHAPDAALPAHLRSPNTWERRAAWHQIAARRPAAILPQLWDLALDATRPAPVRITALWALGEADTAFPARADALFLDPVESIRREAVRALRLLSPDAAPARARLAWVQTEPSFAVRNEVARFWRDARGVQAADLAALLPHYREVSAAPVRGAQGETLPWGGAYEQAFLNQCIRQALEAHPAALDELALHPPAAPALPDSAGVLLRRRTFLSRFDRGDFAPGDLAEPSVRDAALDCAPISPRALALLVAYAATTADPAALAETSLNHPSLPTATLRAIGAPLALRLLASARESDVATGLDLAGIAFTAGDRDRLSPLLQPLPARFPALRLSLVRNAGAAGLRDASLFSALANDAGAPLRVRAAAYTHWFDSAPRQDQPAAEAAARSWLQALDASALPDVLDELASTVTGSHYALNHLFPALLNAEPAARARLVAELGERVPHHGRLPALRERVASARQAEAASAAERIRRLGPALPSAHASDGQPLFNALCLTCHRADAALAPPLEGSARRDEEAILLALLDPAAAVESVFQPFVVRLRDGTAAEGFLQARDGNRIVLRIPGGATRPFSAHRILSARFATGESLMPPLARALSDAQLAGVVRYLRTQ